jgi:hypothetical protein
MPIAGVRGTLIHISVGFLGSPPLFLPPPTLSPPPPNPPPLAPQSTAHQATAARGKACSGEVMCLGETLATETAARFALLCQCPLPSPTAIARPRSGLLQAAHRPPFGVSYN